MKQISLLRTLCFIVKQSQIFLLNSIDRVMLDVPA